MDPWKKDIYDKVLECLVHKPPKIVIIGDDDMGGLKPMADEATGRIIDIVRSFYFQIVGEVWVGANATMDRDQTRTIANEAFLRALGIDWE